MYKINHLGISFGVVRLSDMAHIPQNLENIDWQEYLKWEAQGNVPGIFEDMIIKSSEELWADARIKRDELLASCDWTQLSDAPINSTTKQAWREYRQALRDLPSQSNDPDNVIWPTKPE